MSPRGGPSEQGHQPGPVPPPWPGAGQLGALGQPQTPGTSLGMGRGCGELATGPGADVGSWGRWAGTVRAGGALRP